MANTLSTYTLRHKYFSSALQVALQEQLVAEQICNVDRSDLKTIENPYITEVTAAIQAVAGTYTPAARTVTDDALSVDDEVLVSTHVFDFEMRTSNYDLTANFLDDLIFQVRYKIDQFVLNKILDGATGTYTTPAGGFTSSGNIAEIFANLLSKIGGFSSGQFGKPFVVIENTDLVGIAQAQANSGFSYADYALRNGPIPEYMGVDIYVVRTGTFVTSTLGTLTATNSGHRLFGVKGVATYASPRGVQYEEKMVTGKTGREIVAYGYVGAKVWAQKASVLVDITLA